MALTNLIIRYEVTDTKNVIAQKWQEDEEKHKKEAIKCMNDHKHECKELKMGLLFWWVSKKAEKDIINCDKYDL